MSTFPDWKKHAVKQQEPSTGCIPTIYESMLRAAGATGIDYANFQKDFDLDFGKSQSEPKLDNFHTVYAAIKAVYPNIVFKEESSATGAYKMARLDVLLAAGKLVGLSVRLSALSPEGSTELLPNVCHAMLVVEWDDKDLYLLNGFQDNGEEDIMVISREDIIKLHDNLEGGSEVVYLESWQ